MGFPLCCGAVESSSPPSPPPSPIGVSAEPRAHGPIRRWIIDHDDSWLFVALYITLAVVLSIWISLFWLVVVVGAHFALELIRHRHFDRWWPGVIVRALWEIKLDIALVIFALVIGVYMEFVLGVAGLSGAARVSLQAGARFAGWQRAIRGVLLSVDDGAQVARALLRRKRGNGTEANEEDKAPADDPTVWGGWTARWSLGDRLSIGLGGGSLLMLLIAPLLMGQPPEAIWETVLEELQPFPEPAAPEPDESMNDATP